MLEYYISKRHFPILFARRDSNIDTRMVHYENIPQAANSPIMYRFAPSQGADIPSVAVNPIFLDAPLQIYGDGPIIAEGEFLINQAALIENDTVSYS